MSADNMIVIQQRRDGMWVAQMGFASADLPDPEEAHFAYDSLERAMAGNVVAARYTEYGIHVVEKPDEEELTFATELQRLLNKHSMENRSQTPDFLLAQYLITSLQAYEAVVRSRDTWWNEEHDVAKGLRVDS